MTNAVQRHPWVIMSFFGTSVGAWGSLWAGLEGWWLPFGISAFGLVASLAGVLLWLRLAGASLPRFGDYLTLVKTLCRLWS